MGQGGGQGPQQSYAMSRYVKVDFCVVIGGGDDICAARGAQISHIVSRNAQAEFCVMGL